MTTFLLPFKGLRGAKTRWQVQGSERDRLLLEILEHNLRTVASVVGQSSTVLVSPDPESVERFPQVSHWTSPGRGLNGDLEAAREALGEELRAGALAVLLPDLPELTKADVQAMLKAASQAQVVLCPDHHRVGTNGLVLSPATALEFLFEGASFERHRSRAFELGRTVAVLERPGLAHDADEEADLRRISRL